MSKMVDSQGIWYKLKTTSNIHENRMENPLSTLVNQKGDEPSRIYILFRKENNLHFKIFNCNNYYFEKSKLVDTTEFGVNRIDFAIQKIVYVNDRLIVVKQTYKCDQKALIMYEIKINKAFPIKTKLIEDLFNNSIETRNDGLIFYGGHDQQLQSHSHLIFYSFLTLKFEEIEPKSGSQPESRFLAYSKTIKNQLVITNGYNSYTQFYKGEMLKDIWSFDFRSHIWTQLVHPNNYPVNVSLITNKGDDILFLCNTKRMSVNIYNHTKREFIHIKTNACIEIEKGVM